MRQGGPTPLPAVAPAPAPAVASVPASADRVASPTAILVAVAVAVLAVILAIVDGLRPMSVATEITLLVLSLSCAVLAGIGVVGGYRQRAGRVRRMYVGTWYLIWSEVIFVLGALAWRTPQTTGVARQIAQASVVGALLVLGVGLVAWTVGYLLGPGRLAVAAGRRLASVVAPNGGYRLRSPLVLGCLLGISLAGRVGQILTDQLGYTADAARLVSTPAATGQLLALMVQCGQFAVLVAAIDFTRNRDLGRRLRLVVLLAVEVGMGVLDGMRQDFILTVLALAVVFAVARTFPWRFLVAALLLFILVYTPYNNAYREVVRGDTRLTSLQAITVAPTVLRQTLTGISPGETVRGSFELLVQRLRTIDSVAIVVQRTPDEVPYKPATDMIAAPVIGLVPRFVWPEKPVFDVGYRFNQEYYGAAHNMYSSAAVTPQADLYRRGGLLVVVGGMLLLGMAARLVDRTLHPAHDLRLTVLFVPLFSLLIKSETDVISLLSSVPTQIVCAVLIARVSFTGPCHPPDTPADSRRVIHSAAAS